MDETALNLEFRRGVQLQSAGKLADAEQIYLDILRQYPAHVGATHLLGVIATRTGRPERAVELIEAVIRLRPDFHYAHNDLGIALERLTRFDEALSHYDTAIAQAPNFADAHSNRGGVLNILKRHEEALLSCDRAIELKPNSAEAYNNRGNALREMGNLNGAMACFDKALALDPDFAEAHNNRGSASRDLGNFQAALSAYERALALKPDMAEAHGNRGIALSNLGRFDDAILSFDRAIALRPDDAAPYHNRSLCRLAMGDYERGWREHEWRWNSGLQIPRQDLPGVPWLGESPLAGKTIIVHAEQGLGDSLQFCRYIPMLAEQAVVVLDVQRPLVRLLSGLAGVTRVVATGDPLPAADAWIPMMSLPLAFGTTLENIPAVPYLKADPERCDFWRTRLAALPGRKVGLVWAGSRHENLTFDFVARRRSMTLRQFAPLWSVPDLCLISLQKGDGATRARSGHDDVMPHDWTDELNDFADTAALVEALDLVISVDTAVVHLTGALGKPVWVLNRYDQCWRWLGNRSDSPWYPSARLFRQQTPGDWAGVIRDVVEALRAGA